MSPKKSSSGILILTLIFAIFILSISSLPQLTKAQTSSVDIYSDSKIISLCNFNITDYTLYFNNLGDSAQVVQIIPEGSGAEFITLSNDLLLLKPHEKETVKVFLNPDNKVGTYKTKLEFIINNKQIKELTQTYIFKTCRTFNASVEPSITACYKNKTSINLNIKNERSEILNLLIKYHNRKYSVAVAPLDSINTTVFWEYKKVGNFTDKIILEDEATKYSTTKDFHVEVKPCGAKFFSLSTFVSSSFRKSSQFIIKWWRWILLIVLLIVLIILIILAIRRYKHKREEETKNKGNNEEKIEPVLDVIQGETDIKEVEKAKKPIVNEEKEVENNKVEKEEHKAEEAKEANFAIKNKNKKENEEKEERIKASEVLAKEPYYKRVIKRITFSADSNTNRKINWWKLLLMILTIIIVLVLIILGIKYLVQHPIRLNASNSTVNSANTTQNITQSSAQTQINTTNSTYNTTLGVNKNYFSLSFINLKPFIRSVWSFILLYKWYFLIGIIISIILISYCNQKGYPCSGKKIERKREELVFSKKARAKKTKRKKKSNNRKPKQTKQSE